MGTFISGINQGLIWAVLTIGVYISFRLLDFADLTCEGGFTLGGMVSAVLIRDGGADPILACLVALCAGAIAGMVTGVLNTKLKIPPILAGIITLTGLTSVNLLIAKSRAFISFNINDKLYYSWIDIASDFAPQLISGLIIVIVIILALYWFFGTELGAAIRATGTNENMAKAQGINTSAKKIIALMLSNALIALSGALFAQYGGNASQNMGTGAIVIGLAAVIIGETLIPGKRNFALALIGVTVGSIIYRIIYVYVIYIGLQSEYVKLITAIIVVLALCLPMIKTFFIKVGKKADTYFRGKYPKYNAYAIKRDEKAAARKEEKKQKAIADIKALQLAVHGENGAGLSPFKRAMMERKLARKKAKFELKEGVKALAVFDVIDRETEEAETSKQGEGGQDNA